MRIYLLFTLASSIAATGLAAQSETTMNADPASGLPYYQIPDYPETYTAENVAARMIDGLGFRYYWATEGLREEDLAFRPGEDARATVETLEHILGLSTLILNAVYGRANERPAERPALSFEQMRKATLENLKMASDRLKGSPEGALAGFSIVFKRGEETSEFPFWNLINGPVADALWHVGQVVSFRRSSGNPINPKASVFSGRLVE